MKTYYLDFTITVAVEAESEKEALDIGTEMTTKEILEQGEWSQDFIIFDDEFNEVFAD